jgi:hypothetical protein
MNNHAAVEIETRNSEVQDTYKALRFKKKKKSYSKLLKTKQAQK